MCGVVGYIGKNHGKKYVFEGLSKIGYRGYDATGFGCLSDTDATIFQEKSEGGVDQLIQKLASTSIDGPVAIGHLRWSTHGLASDLTNAHPHLDCNRRISLVHNGIIENYHQLKPQLERSGHVFNSQTDTEVVVHLLEMLMAKQPSLRMAVIDLLSLIEGAFAIIALFKEHPDTLLVIRKRSPLCVGIGDDEMFIASDPLAFAHKTSRVLFIPDETFALVHKNRIELFDFAGTSLPVNIETYTVNTDDVQKGGHEHYMLKEIYDQKKVIYDTVNSVRQLGTDPFMAMGLDSDMIRNLQAIDCIGCGTSWHAGRIAQYFFETVAHLPTRVHLASELRYAPYFPQKNSLTIAISQSGETADTLEALRLVDFYAQPTLALSNRPGSSLVREASGFLLTQAGPEIAVASTKAFTAQLASLYWLAHRIALEKGIISARQLEGAEEELIIAAEILESTIETYKRRILTDDAPFFATKKEFIFLGRTMSYPFAQEAALKLKEIAYIFVDTYPAGELKHGPLALVEKDFPIVLFSCLDPVVYQKLLSNAQELKARSGYLIVFAFEGQTELISLADRVFIIPRVAPLLAPLAMTGVMQYLVYEVAKILGRPIDKPRNLAKSVTVE